MELTLKNFEEMNLYSNKTLEKVMTSLVNESSNAVVVNVFDDAVLLLDHKEGQFYLADYEFDQKKATFKFENFEPIVLTKDTNNFKDSVKTFFEDESSSCLELIDSYKNNVVGNDAFISELVTESMSTKDYAAIADYSDIAAANESTEIRSEKFFESYKERLNTHPLTSIKTFKWDSPVSVSLIETETPRNIVSKMVDLSKNLWKKEDFKTRFNEAASLFIENVEEGSAKFEELLESYPGIFYLDKSERKTLFGKVIISNAGLREDRTDIIKGIELLFEKFDLADLKDTLIEEGKLRKAQLTKGHEGDASVDTEEGSDVPAEEEEEPAPEVSSDEVGKIVDALEKIKGKLEKVEGKEKVIEKLDKIISDLEGSAETGGDAKAVKEAVEILSL